ncbi:MAG: hypothetical protein VW378_02420 [bacterium]
MKIIRKIITVMMGMLISTTLASTALDVSLLPSSASFLRQARIAGFGQTATVIFENPAALDNLNYASMTLFDSYIADREGKLSSLAINYPFKKGSIAIGYIQHSSDVIPHTTALIKVEGLGETDFPRVDYYFAYKDSVLKVGYANSLKERHKIGINLSHFSYKMDRVSGSAFNMDLGLYTQINERLSTSIGLKNILSFSKMNYSGGESNGISYHLPQQVQAALKYQVQDLNILGQLNILSYNNTYADNRVYLCPAIALEKTVFNVPTITVSGGYSQHIAQNKRFGQYSMGINVDIGKVSFDFAYEKTDYEVNQNQFYFSINLKKLITKEKKVEKIEKTEKKQEIEKKEDLIVIEKNIPVIKEPIHAIAKPVITPKAIITVPIKKINLEQLRKAKSEKVSKKQVKARQKQIKELLKLEGTSKINISKPEIKESEAIKTVNRELKSNGNEQKQTSFIKKAVVTVAISLLFLLLFRFIIRV